MFTTMGVVSSSGNAVVVNETPLSSPNHELLTMVCIYGTMQIVLILLDRVYLLLIANRLKFAKD